MAEAGNAPVLGIIRNMGRPEERQEMVLAHGLEADVADGYQAVRLRYNRSGPLVVRIFLQAGKKLAEGLGDAVRRLFHAQGRQIQSQGFQKLFHSLHGFRIDRIG